MFAYLRLNRFLGERFLVMGDIFQFQFHVPLLIVAALGFLGLLRRRNKVALLLGGLLVLMTFIVATYRAPQSVEYLMPAYLPIVLSVGYATSFVYSNWPTSSPLERQNPGDSPRAAASRSHHRRSAILLSVLLLPTVLLAQANLPSYRLLHHDRSARVYAEAVLLDAPPGAHILSNWHWYTPLRYLQLVEGQRPDVEVTYLYPQGATPMPQAWPQRIAQELERSDRPLIVTNAYPTYADLPYRFEPLGEAFLVLPGPSYATAARLAAHMVRLGPNGEGIDLRLEGEPVLRILGYRVQQAGVVELASEVGIDLIWQPLARLEGGFAIFVHLVGDDRLPIGQRDRQYQGAGSVTPREIRVDRYRFPVHLAVAPGTYRLIAGAYVTHDDGSWQRLTTAQGHDSLSLSDVPIEGASLPPVTMHPVQVHFGEASLTLVGIDYDDTLPEQRRVYLHWRAGTEVALARLWAEGQIVAQCEVPVAPTPEARSRYVTTALDVPPGTQHLELEMQRAGETQPMLRRGAWGLLRSTPLALPKAQAQQHYLPFGGEMTLTRAQVESPWHVGREARVALRFVGQRPIVRDRVISVGVEGQAATNAPSDWVPALGAIPTFKWIRGTRVNDVHLIEVYAGQGSEVKVSVGVYDAFTTAALPPLDERIARLGRPAVPLRDVRVR
jgi:hypothetical protein